MAEISYPYHDQEVTDAEYSDLARDYMPTGVMKRTANGSDLQVTANSTGMRVYVLAGRGNVRGHRYRNTTTKELTIPPREGQARVDTVVMRSEYGSVNNCRLVVKKGEAGPSPKPPTLEQTAEGVWEEPLADVLVSAAAVTITPSNLQDRRKLYAPQDIPAPLLHFGPGRAGQPWDRKSQQIVKTGSMVVKCNDASVGSFTWPEGAFPNGLVSVNLTSGDNTVVTPMLEVGAGTDLNKCVIVARRQNGSGVGANLVRVEYIAYGW